MYKWENKYSGGEDLYYRTKLRIMKLQTELLVEISNFAIIVDIFFR